MRSFGDVHPSADIPLTADYVHQLEEYDGATLVSGTVTCAVHQLSPVADASASSRVYGSATVSGTGLTRWFKTGVDGVIYVITFNATFSTGAIDPVEIKLTCNKDAP